MPSDLSNIFRPHSRLRSSVEQDVDLLRSRILLAYTLFTPILLSMHATWFPPLLTGLSVAALIAAAMIAFRRDYQRIGFIYLCTLQFYFCWDLISSQSIHSIYYPMLAGSIIVAALSLGLPLAIWYSILCASTIVVCIERNAAHGIQLPWGQTLTEYAAASTFTILAMESFLLAIALFHDSFRRKKQLAGTTERSRISRSLYNFALGELVGSVSHEVNNPLAIVSAITINMERSIAKEQYTPELEKLVSKLDRALQRIRHIVDGLTLFAKGELNESMEKKSVRSLCEFVREFNHETLERAGIHFCINDLTDNMEFPCRFQQLIRALNGLIKNAGEATEGRTDGRIEFNIFVKQPFLILEVRDNGRGVPEELREHLFEPFFSTKDLKAGQGLTLAVARGLIEAQGGQLIYTPLPHGSSFSILLPVSPQETKGNHDDAA